MDDIINALLIEDNDSDIKMTESLLTKYKNVKLKITSTLVDSMNELGMRQYDVILLDLNLPDSTGLSTFIELNKFTNGEDSINKNIPVLILTSTMNTSMALEALKIGAQDWMVKGEVNGNLHRAMTFAATRHTAKREAKERLEDYITHQFAKIKNDFAGMMTNY